MTDAVVASSNDVVARADFQYRWRVWVFFILMFGYGLWSLRDGFFVWPRENAQWQAMAARGQRPPQTPHNDASLLINRALGILLPALSLPLFIWLMYRSRGQYTLSSAALTAPGRPPVPLDRILALDKSRWDRKGIAVVEYQAQAGQTEKITLRDMVYQRSQIDEMVRRIERHLDPEEVRSSGTGTAGAEDP